MFLTTHPRYTRKHMVGLLERRLSISILDMSEVLKE